MIKNGLIISLRILNVRNVEPLSVERVREVLKKYSQIHHLEIFLKNGRSTLRYCKLNGGKERISIG